MSIAKFDVDVKMSQDLLDKYVMTRLLITEKIGYTVIGHNLVKTEKGYHCWIEIMEKLSDKAHAEWQFLLGDDQVRCRFNFLRNDAGVFQHFNALFSKKLKKKGVI